MWNDPEVLGGFLLVRRIAESRMANVSLAVRLADSTGRPIVLKRPPLGERASGRAAQAILREAEVLGEVRGAGIPALEAAGEIAGLPYVAVERLRGTSLAKALSFGDALPFTAVRALGRDVGRALAKLHAAGWVHRDLTPSNIFVDEAGEAYLLDYGLCERAGDERGAPLAGTRGYAAPEAPTARAPHPAEDVYGLAVCLAEAALGRRLFEETHLVEAAARGDAPPRVVALEGEIPGITAALRRDPSARPSAADLAEALAKKEGAPDDPSGPEVLSALAERAQSLEASIQGDRASIGGATARATVPIPEPARGDRASERAPIAEAARDVVAVERAPSAPIAPIAGARAASSTPIAEAPSEALVASRSASVPGEALVASRSVSVAGSDAEALVAAAPAQAAFGPPARGITPTVAMPAVVVRDVSASSSGIVDTVPDLAPITETDPTMSPGNGRRSARRGKPSSAWLVALVVAVAALAIGFLAGRFGARAARGGPSFAISGPLPKRAEVMLDGKKLTIADGVPMPVPAGSHTLTIATPKNPKREIPFTVHAGEHVVIVSPLKGAADDDGP